MRRLLVIPVLVLGLAAGNALGSTHEASEGGTVGKISALDATSISVDGKRNHDLTCTIGDRSPKTTGFDVGDRVAAVCKQGVLRKLVRLRGSATAEGRIKLLNQRVIGVDADHDVTCRLTDASPSVDGFAVGDRVGIACSDGVLAKLVHLPALTVSTKGNDGKDGKEKDGAGTGTTATAPATVTVSGEIDALGQGSITIDGEHDLTCKLTGDSPIPAQFKVGEGVRVTCTNGVVSSIQRLETPPPPPPPPPAETTTGTVTLSATGAITAITDGLISVHGDRDTSCARGASSPGLGDYKVGDKVRISCSGGVLTGIVRTS